MCGASGFIISSRLYSLSRSQIIGRQTYVTIAIPFQNQALASTMTAKTQNAIFVSAIGQPLVSGERPIPEPPKGYILVKVLSTMRE
jgi:hypothetical protein